MQENHLAAPSNLRHPGNPNSKLRSGDFEVEVRDLMLYCEISDGTVCHAWAGEFDLVDLLTGPEIEQILEDYDEAGR